MLLKPIIRTLVLFILFSSCNDKGTSLKAYKPSESKTRQLADTIGFTKYKWQLDSIISRMDSDDKLPANNTYKAAICPHDDYAYAGGLYNKTLAGIKAKTIVLVGVAHRARNYSLENKLIFGSYNEWKSTNGNISVSALRNKVIKKLPESSFIVHDSMMQLEHSLEAITPFLQKNNSDVEIIPVLVPYITYEHMNKFSDELSQAIHSVIKDDNLEYGKDLAIVISNDAIHYGSEDWGGSNLAPFGVDDEGTEKAKQKDLSIIQECLVGELSQEKIKQFNTYTVKETDFKAYKWTWCGRYSLPFGLLLSNKLNILTENKPLEGIFVDYRSSYHNKHIEVEDIGMGHTAPANQKHWVAYVGVTYK